MAKYRITAPRYLFGHYVAASPEFPAEIELPEGFPVSKNDHGLIAIETPVEKPKPHFVERLAGGAPSAPEHFGKTDGAGPDEAPAGFSARPGKNDARSKGKRPSDSES